MKTFIAGVLAIWFGLVVLLGANGVFARPPGSPPIPILIGALAAPIAFFVAYLSWGAFREFVLGTDLRLVASIQAWRAGGLGFLALHAHGVLPGLFAWPAGLGDIAIGVTAPWIVLTLIREPAFAGSGRFKVWNFLGILDLVIALSMGALNSGLVPGLVGTVTTAPMAQLPLVLIPAYLVPLFLTLHFTALLQARRHQRGAEFATPGQVGAIGRLAAAIANS